MKVFGCSKKERGRRERALFVHAEAISHSPARARASCGHASLGGALLVRQSERLLDRAYALATSRRSGRNARSGWCPSAPSDRSRSSRRVMPVPSSASVARATDLDEVGRERHHGPLRERGVQLGVLGACTSICNVQADRTAQSVPCLAKKCRAKCVCADRCYR